MRYLQLRALVVIFVGALLLVGLGRYAAAAKHAQVAQAVAAPARLPHGEHTRSITVDGRMRKYRVVVPRTVDLVAASPVVLAFHGGGGNPDSMIRLSGLNTSAEKHGFVVVYPYGSARFGERRLTFNAGNVGGYAMQQNIDDVAFTRALLDDLATVARIDQDRVYATGMSNGAMMAYRLASELSDRIAAIAPVGGPMGTAECRPTRPVPVMHFHGTADTLAPFRGGFGVLPDGSKGVTEFFSVEHSIAKWVAANQCPPDPRVEELPDKVSDGTSVIKKTWSGGPDGAEVVLIEVTGGGHTWPGETPVAGFLGVSTKDISANDMMWEFFTRHSRRAHVAPADRPAQGGQEPRPDAKPVVLRTPDERFADLPGYPFAPRYISVTDPRGGTLRMHYVDEGPRDATTILLLHGNPTWSYMFREVIPLLNEAGYRTIALDYIGMGRSDKLPLESDYTYDRHVGWVREAFAQIDRNEALGKVVIFGHDYGVPIGIRLMAEHYPTRVAAFIASNASIPVGDGIAPTHQRWRQFVRDNPDVPIGNVVSSRVDPPLTGEEIAAYNAPYPNASFKASIRAFPEMVPEHPDRPEALANQNSWKYLEAFDRPFMTIFGRASRAGGPNARDEFMKRVPGARDASHPQLDVTHYAPEDRPREVARQIIGFLTKHDLPGSGRTHPTRGR